MRFCSRRAASVEPFPHSTGSLVRKWSQNIATMLAQEHTVSGPLPIQRPPSSSCQRIPGSSLHPTRRHPLPAPNSTPGHLAFCVSTLWLSQTHFSTKAPSHFLYPYHSLLEAQSSAPHTFLASSSAFPELYLHSVSSASGGSHSTSP